MLSLRAAVYVALGVVGTVFCGTWARQIRRDDSPRRPTAAQLAIGFVTNFFDTLGIGSFATTTSLWRLLRMVPDALIPGSLLVGHTLPTFAQAFIFVTIVKVDATTLALMIGASVAGSWLGARTVSRWDKRLIQRGMGIALLGAAAVMLAGLCKLLPAGGELLGLSGWRLAAGFIGNLLMGALMTLGIGSFAPSLIMFGLLGMNVRSIFPIMMGSNAFLMPVGGLEFVKRRRYSLRASLGLALGGVPAVLLAAFLVKELPLAVLRWIVLVVVIYTGVSLLRSARTGD
jgi:uncharacterized membrane protein YfcA